MGRAFTINPLDVTEAKRKAKAVILRKGYILTLDYTFKILAINERMKAGLPVIIQGETGVGKTGTSGDC